jgi:hypothetical protein
MVRTAAGRPGPSTDSDRIVAECRVVRLVNCAVEGFRGSSKVAHDLAFRNERRTERCGVIGHLLFQNLAIIVAAN